MALSNKRLNTQLQFKKKVLKMFEKCDPTEKKQILQREILQYLIYSAGGIVFPPHQRWDVMSFFLLSQKKIHSLSISRKPLLLECCFFGFPTSSMFSSVCSVSSIALMLSSKPSLWIFSTRGFHSLTLVLNFGTTWFTESVLHLLQCFPENSHFQSPSMTFFTCLPVPQPCQGSSTLSSTAFSWCCWFVKNNIKNI